MTARGFRKTCCRTSSRSSYNLGMRPVAPATGLGSGSTWSAASSICMEVTSLATAPDRVMVVNLSWSFRSSQRGPAVVTLTGSPPVPPTKARVLVVDDYPDSAEIASMLLTLYGHECRIAVTGQGALEQAAEFD